LEAIHPDDIKLMAGSLREHAKGKWNYEYRIIRPDKSIRWISDRGFQVTDENGNLTLMVGVASDISRLKKIEKKLNTVNKNLEITVRKRTSELKIKNKMLEEYAQTMEDLNTTLKILLQKKEETKEEFKENLVMNVKEQVMPFIENLKNTSLNRQQSTCLEIIESNLNQIASSFANLLSSKHYNLTPKELKIASLIKNGKSSKEIAEILIMSKGTVDWYRDQIRNKVGIKNQKINLQNKLKSLL